MPLLARRPSGRMPAFLASVLVAALLSSNGNGQAPQAAPIERAVLDHADSHKGEVSFWLIFREKAPLAAAARIENRDARGRYVYERATEVAARSQAGLQRLLRA